jgi:predicted nuclease with TOPRIM domain
LILSKALKAQKEAEDESCQIALGNLWTEVISLRNEALEKDKMLFSLVDRLKTNETKLSAQAEAHKAEVEDLKKKLAEMNEKFEVANAKHEISEIERLRVEKNVEELRNSKERCYEISLECTKTLRNSFTKVGANSSEQKIIRGDPDDIV